MDWSWVVSIVIGELIAGILPGWSTVPVTTAPRARMSKPLVIGMSRIETLKAVDASGAVEPV